MKLNKEKVGTLYRASLNEGEFIEGSFDLLEYGWYESGKAFIAWNGRVMSFAEAYSKLVPKCSFNLYNAFFVGVTRYQKTIDGIVRYLIEKYNKN